MLTTGAFTYSLLCPHGICVLNNATPSIYLSFYECPQFILFRRRFCRKLAKTKTFNEFNLLLSRHCLLCEPSVLLFMISSFLLRRPFIHRNGRFGRAFPVFVLSIYGIYKIFLTFLSSEITVQNTSSRNNRTLPNK